MVHNKVDANRIQSLLMNEGFLVKLRSIGRDEEGVFEVLVPNGEVEEAHEVLVNFQ
jgi:type III secretory pathway lipoprotein EscJ